MDVLDGGRAQREICHRFSHLSLWKPVETAEEMEAIVIGPRVHSDKSAEAKLSNESGSGE